MHMYASKCAHCSCILFDLHKITFLFIFFIVDFLRENVQRGWELLEVCLDIVLPSPECEQSLADFIADTVAELNVVRMRAASL